MSEDFAILDFALVAADPDTVALALARGLSSQDGTKDGEPEETPDRKGLLSRFVAARLGARGSGGLDLMVQHPETMREPPFARRDIGALRDAHTEPLRVSGPVGTRGLTFVEFLEPEIGQSSVAKALSAQLPGEDIFYFRYSGARHPGADFAFHVYHAGRASRRAASLSFNGATEEANWSSTDSGIPHAVEAGCLPPPNTPKSGIMTPGRQARILKALGIEPEDLINPDPEQQRSFVLSRTSGGTPVEEAIRHVEPKPVPVEEPAAKRPKSKVPVIELPEREEQSTEQPEANVDPADQTASASTLALREAEAAHAPTAGTEAAGDLAPEGPPSELPPAEPVPDVGTKDWENEVTAILLDAVEDALPEGDQISWLDALTKQLESGDVVGALREASRLILSGSRSNDEKRTAVERLTALYSKIRVTTPR